MGQPITALQRARLDQPEGGNAAAPSKALHSVDFSEPALAKARPTEAVKAAALAPVAILSKPEPVYTKKPAGFISKAPLPCELSLPHQGRWKLLV